MFDKMLKKALGFRDEDEIFGDTNDVEGPGDPEIMGGMGHDMPMGHMGGAGAMKPGMMAMPGVDRATGKPYRPVAPSQSAAASSYPGQGGSGYPVGSEAGRMNKPAPMGRPDIQSTQSATGPGLSGGVYVASDGRVYDLDKDPALIPHAANGYQSIIDMIEKKAPLAERWRRK